MKFIKEKLNSLKESVEMAHHLISTFTDKVNCVESRILEVEKTATEIPPLRKEVESLARDMEVRDQ